MVSGPVEFAPGVVSHLTFQVVDIAMQMILGMPWLSAVRPHIDWRMGCVHFELG